MLNKSRDSRLNKNVSLSTKMLSSQKKIAAMKKKIAAMKKKEATSSSFAQKYNLKGQGKRITVSEKTKAAVDSLYRKCDDLVKKGKEYSQNENRGFGGCPRPGEDGSEKYFSTL